MNSNDYNRETKENENNSCFESDIQHSTKWNLDLISKGTEGNENNSCFESDEQHSNE